MTGRLWVKEDHLRLLLFLERGAAHCQKPSESGKPSCTETGAFEDIRERKTHFRPKQLITKYISDLKGEPWYLINPWFSRVQQTYTAVSKVLVLGKQCLRVQKSDFKKTLYFGEPKTSTFLQHFWATNFLSRFYNSRGGHLECSVFGNRLFYCMLVSSILTALMIPLLDNESIWSSVVVLLPCYPWPDVNLSSDLLDLLICQPLDRQTPKIWLQALPPLGLLKRRDAGSSTSAGSPRDQDGAGGWQCCGGRRTGPLCQPRHPSWQYRRLLQWNKDDARGEVPLGGPSLLDRGGVGGEEAGVPLPLGQQGRPHGPAPQVPLVWELHSHPGTQTEPQLHSQLQVVTSAYGGDLIVKYRVGGQTWSTLVTDSSRQFLRWTQSRKAKNWLCITKWTWRWFILEIKIFFFIFRMHQIGTFSAGRRRAQRSRVIERKFIVQTFISRNIDRSLLKSSYGRTPWYEII